MILAWVILSKVVVCISEILVLCSRFCHIKKKNKWKMQTVTYLLTNLRSVSKSINAIVPFWNEMCPMHYGRQASLCSIISKLSRRGCCFFFPLLSTLPDRQTVKACVSKAWNTGICEDTQISLAALAERETGAEAAENGLVRVITSQ